MWFDQSVIYQIYPLGLCGAPEDNDGVRESRILRLLDWVEHIKKLGADTVLFNPVFESDRHGYDTRDYFQLDCRLGTNEDFAQVCDAFHQAGIRVMLDGVFNHVGRGFWAFRDVQEKRWDSPYKDWFRIDFNGNSHYNDGFWYADWEGHGELVKLNLDNPAVVEHQFEAIRAWVDQFDIDGLRLDVAYCLPQHYLRRLREFTSSLKPDFALMGETLHGDYKQWMAPDMCHSVTNYECYKGLWSSFNSMNLFEIGHSLARQFGPEPWTMYKGAHLLSFLDNHDVTRIASQLTNKEHLAPRLCPDVRYAWRACGVLRQRVGPGGQEGVLGRRSPAPRPGEAGVEPPHRLDFQAGPCQAGESGSVLRRLPQCGAHQPPAHL